MITILCEKNSAAKNFAKALGGMTGTLNGDTYQIVAAAGHLFEFKDLKDMVAPEDVARMTSWDIEDLPFDRRAIRVSYTIKPTNKAINLNPGAMFKRIKASIDKSSTVIIATDNDPSGEGDLLAWEIIAFSGFKGQVLRCDFVDESSKVIQKYMSPDKLRPVDVRDGKYVRAMTRQLFDFYSVQYTRAVTDVARKRGKFGSKDVSHEGRLKTPMKGYIGERAFAHDTFVPHSSYTTAYLDSDNRKYLSKEAPEYQSEADAQRHLVNLPNSNVKQLSQKDVSKEPPALIDLSMIVARLDKLGYDGKEVENVVQKMYLDGVVSYPRTEDKVITEEQLAEMIPLVHKIASILDIDTNLINPSGFRKKLIGSGSHGANRPGLTVPDSQDMIVSKYGDVGLAVYDLLARSFLSGFAPPAIYQDTIYSDESGKYTYKYSVPKSLGYQRILHDISDAELDGTDEDVDEKKSPPKIGDELRSVVHEIKAVRPGYATVTSLMNFLSKNSIGTGATRVATLNEIAPKKMTNRKSVDKKGGKLHLNKKGNVSFLLMKGTYLGDFGATKQLDSYLEQVEKGAIPSEEIYKLFDTMITHDLKKIISNANLIDTLEDVKEAPKAALVEGVFVPSNTPVKISSEFFGHKFTESELADLFAGNEITFKVPAKKGDPHTEEVLSDPSRVSIVKGKLGDRYDTKTNKSYGFGFVRTSIEYPKKDRVTGVYEPTGETIEFPANFGAHKFTDDEITKLLQGKTISFKAKKKNGSGSYDTKGSLQFVSFPENTPKRWQFTFDKRK